MSLQKYPESEDADLKLAEAVSKTNIIVMVILWVALPKYRIYLEEPIKVRLQKLFHLPGKSFLHGKSKDKRGTA